MKDFLTCKEMQKVVLIISFVYILPVLLIFCDVVPFAWRFYVLALASITTLLIARIYQFSLAELGFTRNQLVQSLSTIALPTGASTLQMIIHYCIYKPHIDNSDYQWTFYLFFVGVSAPLQEFLYRGFLFAIFAKVKFTPWLQILISTLLYSFVHLVYRDASTLVLTFAIGLLWNIHYVKFRTLYSTILSHSLLGTVAVLAGLI